MEGEAPVYSRDVFVALVSFSRVFLCVSDDAHVCYLVLHSSQKIAPFSHHLRTLTNSWRSYTTYLSLSIYTSYLRILRTCLVSFSE